jgi:hypothetical protein
MSFLFAEFGSSHRKGLCAQAVTVRRDASQRQAQGKAHGACGQGGRALQLMTDRLPAVEQMPM